MGSGCGAVGRPVASKTRDLRFESSHPQYYLLLNVLKNYIEKTKINKKRPGMARFLKKRKKEIIKKQSLRRTEKPEEKYKDARSINLGPIKKPDTSNDPARSA